MLIRLWKRRLHSWLPYQMKRNLSQNQAAAIVVGAVVVTFLLLVRLMLPDHPVQEVENVLPLPRGRRPVLSGLTGVHPAYKGHYTPDVDDKFRCIKTFIRIPFENVNDDYCDCPLDDEASDEPATSACTRSQFYCSG